MSYRGGWAYEPQHRRFFPRPYLAVHYVIYLTVAVFLVQFLLLAFRVADLAFLFGVRADFTLRRLRVWQIVTYMFLHSADPWHLVFNMLILYWFGGELERFLGRRRFLAIYFGGGISGGLAYCLTQQLAGTHAPAIGASAAVMAVMVVYACYFPDRTILFFFFIPMTVKLMVLILIAVDLLMSIGAYADGVAHTAHLGGALFGFLYWRFSPAVAAFLDRVHDRRREREARGLAEDESRMDEILAKISRDGFDSLTPRERDFLTRQSQRRRERGYRA